MLALGLRSIHLPGFLASMNEACEHRFVDHAAVLFLEFVVAAGNYNLAIWQVLSSSPSARTSTTFHFVFLRLLVEPLLPVI